MNVTILLYDNFTALDAIGPYEVLRLLPGKAPAHVIELVRRAFEALRARRATIWEPLRA